LKLTSTQFRTSLLFVHNASQHRPIIGLYGTPAVRQAVLRLAWYIRPIRFEIRFERKKTIRGFILCAPFSSYLVTLTFVFDLHSV